MYPPLNSVLLLLWLSCNWKDVLSRIDSYKLSSNSTLEEYRHFKTMAFAHLNLSGVRNLLSKF